MSVLTISSVSSVNDTLTVTGHGLVTGAAPVALYARGGSSIPGGLTALTDYWPIVVDANTIKVATSSANAFLGTAIDITNNGGSPLALLVGIPFRRATTYVAGSQLKSADLDALQDADISMLSAWHFELGHTIGPNAWKLLSGTAIISDEWASFTADSVLVADLHGALRAGERITSIDFGYTRGTSSTTVSFALQRRPVDGSAGWTTITPLTGGSDNSSSGAQTHTLTYDHVLAASYYYRLNVSFIGSPYTGLTFYGANVKEDRLS